MSDTTTTTTTTNFEKWMCYTSGLTSPENYIQWGWRYIIAASLQRRVWLPPSHQPCFCNLYVIPVGRAGLGKGLVVSAVKEFLTHWKLKDAMLINKDTLSLQEKQKIDIVHTTDLQKAQDSELQPKNTKNAPVEPLLIPVAANATTYEALVQAVAESYRRINYIETVNDKPTLKVYGHSSLCFALPELASLLRKRTDDTVNYMLELYDCPLDYEYDTKTQGKDRVRRGCLNFFAATTPDFMQEVFSSKLINQGFGSRVMFICADKDRSTKFFIPEHTEEQLEHKKHLLNHIRMLTTLYGKVEMSQETTDYLELWWERFAPTLHNLPAKLEGFGSRMKVHVMKVAMTEHFGESLEMTIPIECFKRAIDILTAEMKNMNFGLMLSGTNPIANISRTILQLLTKAEKNFLDLHIDTNPIATKSELTEALTFLIETGQVEMEDKKDDSVDEVRITYKLKKQRNGD